jgi:hypothetical protein
LARVRYSEPRHFFQLHGDQAETQAFVLISSRSLCSIDHQETGATHITKSDSRKKEQNMLGTILIVILILALVGALPRWSHSREWGYAPTGGLGLVLFIVIILLVLGRI